MYSKLHCFTHFLIALVLGLAGVAAQAQTPDRASFGCDSHCRASYGSAATATLHGHIADPTGALIPGATVTITTSDGQDRSHNDRGRERRYQVSGLAPGSYIVQAIV